MIVHYMDRYVTLYLSVIPLMNVWVVSTFLVVVNGAPMNIHVQIFVWTFCISLGWVTRNC